MEIAAYLQRKGNGGSNRNTLLGEDQPVYLPVNIEIRGYKGGGLWVRSERDM